jgi:guanylate kinase
MKKNNIVALIGFSASGKDTVARILEKEYGYNFVVNTTTRPIRPGESERNPYNFTTNDKFEKLISDNKLIEYREYNTLVNNIPAKWYYGVESKEVDPNKKYVVVLDIGGLRGFSEHFGDSVISFFLEASDEVRKERCLLRGDFDETEWNRRLEDDKKRFTDDIINNEVHFVVDSEREPNDVVKSILNVLNVIEEK